MAQRIAEHAAAGLLTGAVLAIVLRGLRVRVGASWVESSMVGGCAAILFTIADGKPTELIWSVGVAAAAALLYTVARSAVRAPTRRGRPTSGT